MARVTMTERVARSLTLLWVFVFVSAAILGVGAALLGSLVSHALREQALDDAKESLAQYTNGVLGPRLVYGTQLRTGDAAMEVVRQDLANRPDIVSVKVWRADGVLAWTSLAPERIGRSFPIGDHLAEVLRTGEASAELESLEGTGSENAEEARLGLEQVLETYAPIVSGEREVIGAYEIYADASGLEASIAARKHAIWIVTALIFAILWALLLLLARGASTMLRQQTAALRERSIALSESYRLLEESSLEAIEGLNATVEAKDPYTAGHSHRVQRVALAVGRELGLAPTELESLRFGTLFHDIGKIAVPDVLLTKPDRLASEEYDLMKRHAAEGARIVSKFARLRNAVPVVRHHHERWDGTGYPEGLAGQDVPLGAAVAALAEAWDAMTLERPYRRGLSLEAALGEVRACSGTQFAPAVVDAFLAAVQKRPAEFGLPESASLAAG